MKKEECRVLLEDYLGDMYWDDDVHELTNAEINRLAEFFSKCGLGRELALGNQSIWITYKENAIVFCCGDAYHSGSYERAKRKADKINARGYTAEIGVESSMYNTYVKDFFKKKPGKEVKK